jgi:transcriptional regulator with XRE-family HTH domain
MNLGEQIKDRRIQRGLTQAELSEKCGLTLRTVQRIENNKVKPSIYSLKLISEVLQVPYAALQKASDQKPYYVEFKLSITDMNQFITDLKILVKTHWKTIGLIILIIWLVTSYTDIKSGIMDGWNNR